MASKIKDEIGSAPPSKSPSKVCNKTKRWKNWQISLAIVLGLVATSPVWAPICLVILFILYIIAWTWSLPAMPVEFKNQPLAVWVEQADAAELEKRREAVSMIAGMLNYRGRDAMNCAGGVTFEETDVFEARITHALLELEDAIFRILTRDVDSPNSELQISAIRALAAAAGNPKLADTIAEKRVALSNALAQIYYEEFSATATKSEAAFCFLRLANDPCFQNNEVEAIEFYAYAALASNVQCGPESECRPIEFVIDRVTRLSADGKVAFLEASDELLDSAPTPEKRAEWQRNFSQIYSDFSY